MKSRETRAMYQQRKRAEFDAQITRRLESEERLLTQQLECVRRQIAEKRAQLFPHSQRS